MLSSFNVLKVLCLWLWERSDKIMKALRVLVILTIAVSSAVFAIHFILKNRQAGFNLILPVILVLIVPAICCGTLLFAWMLTERSRSDERRFLANCIAWVGGFILLALTIVFAHDFSMSSFPLASEKSFFSFDLVAMTFVFAVAGYIVLYLINIYLDKAAIALFIFLLVAASSIVLYLYYFISSDNWAVIAVCLGVILGATIYGMTNGEAIARIKAGKLE